MQRLEVSGAVRPIYGSLGVKRLRAAWSQEMVAEFLVFQFVIEKSKDQDGQNFNFACFVLVWNLVAHTEEGNWAKSVWEYGVEENIWA